MTYAALSPLRAAAATMKLCFDHVFNPAAHSSFGRSVSAACELLERTTRRYEKPAFGIEVVAIGQEAVSVSEQVVWARPFCNLIHFRKSWAQPQHQPKLLIVAPMSGHYATLLRGTVAAMLPFCDVYITDWVDARQVPLSAGDFDLNSYIEYTIQMLHALGGDTHVMAVCQPSVPVLAAVALMEEEDDPLAPLSMTLMGGPIDTRISPTAVNALAQERGIDWFRRSAIAQVPFPYAGV